MTSQIYQTKVQIKIEGDSKYVYLHQPLFVNKIRKLSYCYSIEFSDQEIVNDLNRSGKYPEETFILKSNL